MNLKLPRGYISSNQMNIFKRSKARYISIYVDGEEDNFKNDHMELGEEFAKARAGEKSDREDIEMMKELLPTYPKREIEFNENLGKIPLKGILDGFDPRKKIIGEDKTGKKWTQGMVNKHDQLLFYALCVWLKYKKVPKVWLHWVQTERDENGELILSGHFENFERKVTLADILLFSAKVRKVAKEISNLVKEYG